MGMKSFLAAGVIGAVVIGGGVAASADGAASPPKRCDEPGTWPAIAQGQPRQFEAGDKGAMTMWHDDGGWHVRVTHRPNGERTFTGRITTPTGRFVLVREVKDEAADKVSVSDGGKTLAYSFSNHGFIDGLDFRVECTRRMEVASAADGNRLPTDRIELGRFSAHPTSNPFTLQRT